jgi:CAAX protease family protein
MARGDGYGWAPYWFPMLAFLLLVEIGRRAPESAEPVFLVLRAALPGVLVAAYAWRGAYPELRRFPPGVAGLLGDVGVGLLGAAVWVAPFLLWPGLRPDAAGFDPLQLGADSAWLAIALRLAGYAVVTPFVEELFVRSWMLRFVDVFDARRDFRDVPIARFRWRSFLVVTAYFVFSHRTWEWGVMLAWTLLTMGWFYRRRQLAPLVLVHAVTNGAILAFAVLCDGWFRDAAGQPLSLWFFV